MPFFQILFSKKAEKDFRDLPVSDHAEMGSELKILETSPFPFKKKIKKIKGSREPLYRLRVDLRSQSYRIFYSILKPSSVIILRIVPKKEADRILAFLQSC